MSGIYCLMVQDVSLNSNMRNMLLRAAKVMIEEKREVLNIRSDDINAHIETEFEKVGFADIYGMLFEAEIDSIRGKGTAQYIVRAEDIESLNPDDGFWMKGVISPFPAVSLN